MADARTEDLAAVLPGGARRDGVAPGAGEAAPRALPRRRVQWFALRRDIPQSAYLTLAASSFVIAFLLWEWVSHQSFVNPVFVPSPEKVWRAALDFFADDAIRLDIRVSFVRVTAGFLLSALLAIPLGVLIGAYKVGEGLVQPITEFVRYIPVPALVPLMMVLFGIGEAPKIMLIFAGTFFQMLLMVAEEVRKVPYDLVQVSYTMGASRSEIIARVLWPAALPGVFDALRLCNGWAWTYLVVAELVAANEGLGYRILKFSRFLQTPKIFVYLILLGVIGLTLDLVFRWLHRRLFPWAVTERA
jgi:NitT/TauT family transport system permease protein